eukprot:s2084_g12.t1
MVSRPRGNRCWMATSQRISRRHALCSGDSAPRLPENFAPGAHRSGRVEFIVQRRQLGLCLGAEWTSGPNP